MLAQGQAPRLKPLMRLVLENGGKRKLRVWDGWRLSDLVWLAQEAYPHLAGAWVTVSVRGAEFETDDDVVLQNNDVVHVEGGAGAETREPELRRKVLRTRLNNIELGLNNIE